MYILCAVLIFMGLLVVSCAQNNETAEVAEPAEQEEAAQVEAEKDFKALCEENAEKHPAGPGKVLFDNAQHTFKGMYYYFKGKVVGGATLETTVDDGKAWLVRNEDGYVMPIHKGRFDAEIGDIVEVWGTLSGLKYAASDLGVDNVVGATGSMHAMIVSVNGEMHY